MSAKAVTIGSPTMTKDFLVSNKLGIHARPAAMFVKTANRFSCDIFVEKDGEKVNGKSIMGLMMLAAGPGSKPSSNLKSSSTASSTRTERNLPKPTYGRCRD